MKKLKSTKNSFIVKTLMRCLLLFLVCKFIKVYGFKLEDARNITSSDRKHPVIFGYNLCYSANDYAIISSGVKSTQKLYSSKSFVTVKKST